MKKILRGAIVGLLALSFTKLSHAANYGGIDLHFTLSSTMTVTILAASSGVEW